MFTAIERKMTEDKRCTIARNLNVNGGQGTTSGDSIYPVSCLLC